MESENKELFENMPVPKALFTMAVPTVIGQLIVLFYSMADAFFVGKTDNPSMVGAAALVLPVFNVTLSVASIAGVGGGALLSRLLGQNRSEEARKVYSFSVYFSLAIALVFALGSLIFMKPILTVLGASESTFDYAYRYAFWVIVVGGVPTIMTNVFSNMLRSTGESGKAGFGVTMGGIINVLLDPLFMFVILKPGQEVVGAGMATALSNGISCLYFVFVILRLGKDSPLRLQSIRELPEPADIRMIFTVGVPASIATLLFDLDYIVIDRLMSDHGDIPLAAMGIVLKAERLPLNVGIGICQAMVPMVGYNYAAKNYDRMNKLSSFSLKCGVIFALVSIAAYELFAPQIMKIFIGEAETVAIGTVFLRIRSVATVLMFLSFYHVHLFNSYGRGGEALFLGVMRWAAFNIPMLFLMNVLFGQYGIACSQFLADILTVILSVLVHKRYLKKLNEGLGRNI